jgi:hypothetical protein
VVASDHNVVAGFHRDLACRAHANGPLFRTYAGFLGPSGEATTVAQPVLLNPPPSSQRAGSPLRVKSNLMVSMVFISTSITAALNFTGSAGLTPARLGGNSLGKQINYIIKNIIIYQVTLFNHSLTITKNLSYQPFH